MQQISPSLPIEVWKQILGWATAVPGALDVDPYDPFGTYPRLPFFQEQKALRDSLQIKNALTKVCRSWRDLIIPYLYEAIIISPRGGNTLPILAATLVESRGRSQQMPSAGNQPLGNHTRRLELRIHEHRSVELGSLAEVISCLPNLAILVIFLTEPIYAHVPMPRIVTEALIQTCAPSLQVVHACNDRLHFSRADWKELLASSPSLRHIHHETFAPPTVREDARSLTVRSSWAEAPTHWVPGASSFDDLHYLRYVAAYEMNITMRTTLLLFGRSLRYLEIDRYSNATAFEAVLELSHVCELCPVLQKLVLQLTEWEDLANGECLPSTVTHLGLRCNEYFTTAEQCQSLFEAFRYIEAEALQEIRFLDEHSCTDLRVQFPIALKIGLNLFAYRGWQMSDYAGNLMD
jgi:hypothetical protein